MTMKVDLGSNGKLSLRNIDAAREWLQSERTAWNWVGSQYGRYRDDRHLRQLNQSFQELEAAVQQGDVKPLREALLQAYTWDPPSLLLSTSKEGRFLTTLAARNRAVVTTALAYFLGLTPSEDRASEGPFAVGAAAWGAFAEGMTSLDASTAATKSRATRLAKQLEESTKTAEEMLAANQEKADDQISRIAEQADGLSSEIRSEATTLLEEVKGEYQELKAYYHTELALRAPVDYWAAVAKKYRREALISGGVFAMLAVATLVTLVLQAPGLRHFLTEIERESVAVALVLGMATLVIWGLRMVARIFLSNYHLAGDAAERETMTKTFFALRREGNITDDQLVLALAPPFRPGTTGLVRDDAALEYSIPSLLSRKK